MNDAINSAHGGYEPKANEPKAPDQTPEANAKELEAGEALTARNMGKLRKGDVLTVVRDTDRGPISFVHLAGTQVEFDRHGPGSDIFIANDDACWHCGRFAFAYRPAPSPVGGSSSSEGGSRGVYVASRASIPGRSAMWRMHRDHGQPITASWIDEAGEGESHDLGELWGRIEREVTSSSALILYAAKEDFPLKGAFIEVGMALAARVPVFVVLDGVDLEPRSLRPLGSWAKHRLVSFVSSVSEAFRLAALHPSSAADAKPVAWRWQEYDHPEDPFIYGETGPREHEEHANLTPLYAQPQPSQQAGAEGEREKIAAILFDRFSPNKEWKCWADCGLLGRPTYLDAADAILAALKAVEG